MLRIGLIGAGQIAKVHVRNAATLTRSKLVAIADPAADRARTLAEPSCARVTADAEEILTAADIDAVVIASPTETHGAYAIKAAQAGKAVYCEKPIATTLADARAIVETLKTMRARVMVGFNRRFDPNHTVLRADVRAGAVGRVQIVQVSSRGPNSIPTMQYLLGSGGLFRDKSVHHLDLARWIAGEDPLEISAMGSVIADPIFAEAKDFDTALITMRMKSGALCQIDNARRAVYGYDDRIEVFGTGGLIESARVMAGQVARTAGDRIIGSGFPVTSRERYAESWKLALHAFEAFAIDGRDDVPGVDDGLTAQIMAEAATLSATEGRTVKLADLLSTPAR